MKHTITPEHILAVLAGLSIAACDSKEAPKPEPAATAQPAEAPEVAPAKTADTSGAVEAKEVEPATGDAGKKGEKKCAPGACAPGQCG
jgi:hypothetical protein